MNKTIGDRIRLRREYLKLSQDQLAERLGYSSRSSISKIEKDASGLPQSKILAIARALDTSPGYILGYEESTEASKNKYTQSLPLVLPVLGSVPAGIPLEAIEDIVDYEEIPAKCTNSDKEFFALKVKGDSMSPKYLENDTIILERCEDVDSGTDAVVYVNGHDATLKKVIKKPDCIILQPINPVYDPIVIDYGRDGDPVRIVGRVIELRRKF